MQKQTFQIDASADILLANTLRFLAIDAVQRAKSGHPGLPLGAADLATVLWCYFLKHDPGHPTWPDRDRFVLSAGHGSALLYALLHLWGYGLSLEDLQNFRQYGSLTPGHPEYEPQRGIETTTGPLGQGLGNAVGLALAERWLAAKFNRQGFPLVDHYTYALVGDGDLMEGISHEVASLAGHLKLGRLIVLYDDNGISIDGSTSLSCSDDAAARFAAYGWQVQRCDGHDLQSIYSALAQARQELERPSILLCRTHIGYGSPRQDSSKAHGEPLGEENLQQTKEALGWPLEPAFYLPTAVQERLNACRSALSARWQAWQNLLGGYRQEHPEMAAEWDQFHSGELPAGWQDALAHFPTTGPEATRAASGRALDRLAEAIPSLIGGSADLTPSNNTRPKSFNALSAPDYEGRYIHFGIREHGMGAILNGLALHGLRPYGGTFLVFSDYMRPALRMAALMKLPVVYVFTHDSIGVGEDGPTHQPVEHVMALRAIPNLTVIRPADSEETRQAWITALSRQDGPTALILSRQALPQLSKQPDAAELDLPLSHGAYILSEADGVSEPAAILLATGSEVSLALDAQKISSEAGLAVRVVSMPSCELFEEQPESYRRKVLPEGVPVVAVEAGITRPWAYYTGRQGAALGIDRFGASGLAKTVYQQLGLTAERIAQRVKNCLAAQ